MPRPRHQYDLDFLALVALTVIIYIVFWNIL